MAKARKPARRSIPKARRVKRSRMSRIDVTRAEYNEIIDVLNERNAILNALRQAVERLEQFDEIQLHRTGQIQAELDVVKRTLEKLAGRVA
ncbi:MAG TPA: hypothetical protein VFP91_12345 [Vicinamibacterales bacterium]|nr:hypothetical protein [Vicinamibacterales bacterium]